MACDSSEVSILKVLNNRRQAGARLKPFDERKNIKGRKEKNHGGREPGCSAGLGHLKRLVNMGVGVIFVNK